MQLKNFIKIFSYLVSLIAVAPVFPFIRIEYIIFFFLTLIISFKIEFKKRLILNILAIVFILFSLQNISFDNVVIPAIHSLIILIGIKFLEEKKYRDYMQIYLLDILCLAGYSLLSLSILFLIYLTITICLLTIAGVLITYFNENEGLFIQKKDLFKIVSSSSLIFFLSIPIAFLIFFILPRIDYPFLDFLNNEKAITGFSDRITLGNVKEIQEDRSVIFRVKMKKIPEKFLYWRGITLNYFDGITWRRKNFNENGRKNSRAFKGIALKQLIYLEPYNNKYLFAIDKPVEISYSKAKITPDLSIENNQKIYKRIRYKVYSVISDSLEEKNINKSIYLQIPENISKKIISLGKKLGNYSNIVKFFRGNNFKYSLSSLPVSKNPLEDFIFNSKKGNCEFFASAFALLLRIVKIPSRVVAGYKGGIYSKFGNYYIITQNNAHVWVEAYLNNKWKRIDPTEFAINTLPRNFTENLNLKMLIDLINYYWIAAFINYDFNMQMNVVLKMYQFSLKKIYLLYVIIFTGIFLLIIFIMKNFKIRKNYEKIIEQFYKIMNKAGYEKKTNETLKEFVENIDNELLKQNSEKFVNLFYEIYYTDKEFNRETCKKLNKLLDNISLKAKG